MNWMSAAAFRSDHQRASGELLADFRLRDGRTALADLRQEGCLKMRFPRGEDWKEGVCLNSSGGVAGGDRLRTAICVREGAQATITAQAAERFYRALPDDPPARVRTAITVAAGAAAEWLPQEGILFDRCALDRTLEVEVAEGGWFLGVEALVFGRAAMGETVASARLSDTIRIIRQGKLLLHDAIRIDGALRDLLARPASGGGARAVATLVHVADDAEGHLQMLRDAWADVPAETGASAWNSMLVGRLVARDAAALRVSLIAGLQALRAGRMLPRVWMC